MTTPVFPLLSSLIDIKKDVTVRDNTEIVAVVPKTIVNRSFIRT